MRPITNTSYSTYAYRFTAVVRVNHITYTTMIG